jgi:hypothetical protein
VHQLQRRDLFGYNRGCFEFYLYELFGRDPLDHRRSNRVYELFGRNLFGYRWSNRVYELFKWDLFGYK